ncbi:MAG: YicC family protein [Phycisphaerae bacterium]|jgi:uncharacterized protein (TIGR00255 family)
MILSMTGYGEAQHSDDGVSYALELRSLNNRYFKASIKLPEQLGVFEPEVEKLLRSRLSRGSITYTLRMRDTRAEAAQEINVAAVESYVRQLGRLHAQVPVQIDLAAILALPGVCQPPALSEVERQRQWRVLETLTGRALDHLVQMRRIEGKALRDDLLNQCAQIRKHLAAVSERAPRVLQEYHQRLLDRTNELLSESKLQLQLEDLKREVAVYAERCDINEEVARLSSHLDQFERLCDSRELAGRKLDFLAQELLRETNTIGSKANDAVIVQHIVEIKGAIDRLKEQVQNVE